MFGASLRYGSIPDEYQFRTIVNVVISRPVLGAGDGSIGKVGALLSPVQFVLEWSSLSYVAWRR